MIHNAACRAMAANPTDGSRLLQFWFKVPNTNSEIGTTLSHARARGIALQALEGFSSLANPRRSDNFLGRLENQQPTTADKNG
jgi:hypothetical protein